MSSAVIAIVVAGLAVVAVSALVAGLDVIGLVIILFTIAFGALAIAVATRSRRGSVQPAVCKECGGLISPSAPYCKHCGARTA